LDIGLADHLQSLAGAAALLVAARSSAAASAETNLGAAD
jgi:hypothetical protein